MKITLREVLRIWAVMKKLANSKMNDNPNASRTSFQVFRFIKFDLAPIVESYYESLSKIREKYADFFDKDESGNIKTYPDGTNRITNKQESDLLASDINTLEDTEVELTRTLKYKDLADSYNLEVADWDAIYSILEVEE